MLPQAPLIMRAFVTVVVAAASIAGVASSTASAHSAVAADDRLPVAATTLDACPVTGVVDYGDSWGDARSGGRRHEGVDMAAQRGAPVVAVKDGEAEFKRSDLGGNAIWLASADGQRYYYAHLDAWAGESRTVTAGEIIGYVGSTGNARGDHLHFEVRLGEAATNPYPLVLSACATDQTVPVRGVASGMELR